MFIKFTTAYEGLQLRGAVSGSEMLCQCAMCEGGTWTVLSLMVRPLEQQRLEMHAVIM